MNKVPTLLLALSLAAAATLGGLIGKSAVFGDDPAAAPAPDQAAVQRARKMVQMLDNIYKQTVVLITDKYVHDEDDFAAGSAAVLLFKNISESGSHQVRLLDVTGQPYESKNVARDAFEREGVRRLKEGAAMHEQIVRKDDAYQLRAITAVPVVMKKCIMCHEHYADVKPGQAVGAISYIVPIE